MQVALRCECNHAPHTKRCSAECTAGHKQAVSGILKTVAGPQRKGHMQHTKG